MWLPPISLLQQCAPDVAPVTMAAVVQHESGGNPLAIYDDTARRSLRPGTPAQAAQLANTLLRAGHVLDLGLAQISSRNLASLHLSVDGAFDPCRNLAAAQSVLQAAWRSTHGSLRATLQTYNTGQPGGTHYADQVFAAASAPAPRIPAIPNGQLAAWTRSQTGAAMPRHALLPPVRLTPQWLPNRAPLSPTASGLVPRWK